MPPMFFASRALAQMSPKHRQDDEADGIGPQPRKFIHSPKNGYGFTANLLSDDLWSLSRDSAQVGLQVQEVIDLEPEAACTFIAGPDDPTDFMGRLLEIGGVVETLRALYRSQGDDVCVLSGWRGVIVKLDDAGDALVSFSSDGAPAKRWIRRKHLGALKKLEEEDLEQCCATPESNNSFCTVESANRLLSKDGMP